MLSKKNFWRSTHGFGLIETAIVLPLFLMLLFGMIDFGRLILDKNRLEGITQNVVSLLRQEPNIAPETLEKYIMANVGNRDPDWTAFHIVSSIEPKNADDFSFAKTSANLWGTKNYANPWLNDSDPSNDNNLYYINVRGLMGYAWITPLPRLIGMVSDFPPDARASHGRKALTTFSVIAVKGSTPSCPPNQVLIAQGDGSYTCQPVVSIPNCAAGETLVATGSGGLSCQAMPANNTAPSPEPIQPPQELSPNDQKILQDMMDGMKRAIENQ